MDIKKIIEQFVAWAILLALALGVIYLSVRFQPTGPSAKRPIFYRETGGLISPVQPR